MNSHGFNLHLPGCVALLLHAFACICFVEAGSAEQVSVAQPIVGSCIAFVIVATFCWEWQLFGNPRRLGNLAGHTGFFFALVFLVSALFSPQPGTDSLLGLLARVGKWAAGLLGIIPEAVFDVISSPGIALLFIGICLALAIPRRDLALGFFVFVAFIAVLFGVTGHGMTYPGWFFAGLVFLGLALRAQYQDLHEQQFWSMIAARLRGDRAIAGDLELKLRLLKRLYETKAALPERKCLGLIARASGGEPEDAGVVEATKRVVRQLIDQDHLASIIDTGDGRALTMNHELDRQPASAWFQIVAGIPKALIVSALALVWIVSPIDLIPDAWPGGALDDAGIAVIAGAIVARSLGLTRRRSATTQILDAD